MINLNTYKKYTLPNSRLLYLETNLESFQFHYEANKLACFLEEHPHYHLANQAYYLYFFSDLQGEDFVDYDDSPIWLGQEIIGPPWPSSPSTGLEKQEGENGLLTFDLGKGEIISFECDDFLIGLNLRALKENYFMAKKKLLLELKLDLAATWRLRVDIHGSLLGDKISPKMRMEFYPSV